jgi:small subunit ribosomal protein S20
MPNIASAKKRLRQSLVRRARNRSTKSLLRSQIRKVREAVAAGNVADAETALRSCTRFLDRAAAHRVVHKNSASRLKSRLSARIKALKQKAA